MKESYNTIKEGEITYVQRDKHRKSDAIHGRYKLFHFKGEDYSIVKGIRINSDGTGKDPKIDRFEFGVFSPEGDSVPSSESIRNPDLIRYMSCHDGTFAGIKGHIRAMKFHDVNQLALMFRQQTFEVSLIEFIVRDNTIIPLESD